MNVFLLVVALAAPVEVPKSGLQEAAAATAAVASEAVLPTVSAVCGVETTLPQIGVISEVETTPPLTGDLWGGAVSPAPNVEAAIPPRMGVLPCPADWSACSLADMYSRTRLLSGAWSITRRLKAARIRGDTDEARRMETLLGEMVSKAIFDEAEGAEP